MRITLHDLPIATLARVQQPQANSNNCVPHSIAALYNLHFGWHMDGHSLACKLDQEWINKPFLFREGIRNED